MLGWSSKWRNALTSPIHLPLRKSCWDGMKTSPDWRLFLVMDLMVRGFFVEPLEWTHLEKLEGSLIFSPFLSRLKIRRRHFRTGFGDLKKDSSTFWITGSIISKQSPKFIKIHGQTAVEVWYWHGFLDGGSRPPDKAQLRIRNQSWLKNPSMRPYFLWHWGVGPLRFPCQLVCCFVLEALETLGRSCEKLQRWRVTKRIRYGWHWGRGHVA